MGGPVLWPALLDHTGRVVVLAPVLLLLYVFLRGVAGSAAQKRDR